MTRPCDCVAYCRKRDGLELEGRECDLEAGRRNDTPAPPAGAVEDAADYMRQKVQEGMTPMTQLLATPAARQGDATDYARRLAVSMHQKHYADEAPNWKPFDDLMGLLSQIDNMTTGLMRKPEPSEAMGGEDAARWRMLEKLVDPQRDDYWYVHPGAGSDRMKSAAHLRTNIDAARTREDAAKGDTP